MTAALVLPPTTTYVSDARDQGRVLRVSWHPGKDQFVLSVWRGDTCAASFQLVRADAPGLIASLAEGLAATPAPWSSSTTSAAPGVIARLRRRLDGLRDTRLTLRS